VARIAKEKISINANFYNDLGVDSLMKVEILAAVHKETGMDIPERLAYEINTFGDLVKFGKEYQAGRGGDELGQDEEIEDFIRKNARLKIAHNLAYFIFRLFFKAYFKQSVLGLENIPNHRSFIIAANHASMLDFPLILTSLPFGKMKNVFAPAAKDYFYAKKYRRSAVELLFNTFPFERMGDFIKGLKTCETLVKKGYSIILFPEGTRNPEGRLESFKPGLGSLAHHLKVPILPVYIHGAFAALPKGKIMPKGERITVYFGQAIYPDKLDFSRLQSDYEKYVFLSDLAFQEVRQLKERS
jgi:long-chain acyl-CoA synthetase